MELDLVGTHGWPGAGLSGALKISQVTGVEVEEGQERERSDGKFHWLVTLPHCSHLPFALCPPFALNVSSTTSVLSVVIKVALFSFLLKESGPGPLPYNDVRE